MGALRKFFAAPAHFKRTALAAGFTVVFVRAGLWLLPFPRLLRTIERLSRPSSRLVGTQG